MWNPEIFIIRRRKPSLVAQFDAGAHSASSVAQLAGQLERSLCQATALTVPHSSTSTSTSSATEYNCFITNDIYTTGSVLVPVSLPVLVQLY
jgi:hypothetical protein